MSFTPFIPESGESLGLSRLQVLNNFAILRSTLGYDHVDVNNPGNGKHMRVTLLDVTAPGTSGTTDQILFGYNGGTRVAIQMKNQGPGVGFIPFITLQPSVTNPGYTCLPGFQNDTVVMQWGTVAPAILQTATKVVLPIDVTVVIAVILTPKSGSPTNNNNIYVLAKNGGAGSNFFYFANEAFVSFDYVAICRLT